jgi:uncharacterized protein YaiE (UPF0345 family)
VTYAFNGPSAKNVQRGGNDVTVFRFSMTSVENIEVRSTGLKVAAVSHAGFDGGDDGDDVYHSNLITDIKIVDEDTGATVAGPKDVNDGTETTNGSAGYSTITYTDRYDITLGTTRNFKVTADFADDSDLNNDVYAWTLVERTATNIKSTDTGDFIGTADIIPYSAIAGRNMTVVAGSLAVSMASSPANQTFVIGTSDVEAGGLLFAAGDATPVTITGLSLGVYTATTSVANGSWQIADTGAGLKGSNLINSVSLYESDGTTLIAGPESLTETSSTCDVVFTGLNWIVPAGQSEKVIVKVDLTTVAPSTLTDYFAFDIDAKTDVTAEDEDGTSVTLTAENPNTTGAGDGDAPTIYQTVASAGKVYISKDSGSPAIREIVIGGQTDVLFAKYKFEASNEAFVVDTITLDNSSTSGVDDELAKVSISYPKESGTGEAVGYLSAGEVTFSSMDMYVPRDGQAILTVKADIDTMENYGGAADSGHEPALYFSTDVTNDDQFKAVGEGSGTTLTDDDTSSIYLNGAALADSTNEHINTDDGIKKMVVRRSKPTIALSSTQNNTLSSVSDLVRFKVTADENGDVTFKKLKFEVIVTDAATSSALTVGGAGAAADWAIYNLSIDSSRSDDLAAAADAFGDASATSTITYTNGSSAQIIYVEFDDEEIIPAGGTYEYVLEASVTNITGVTTEVDRVRTRLAASLTSVITDEIYDDGLKLVGISSSATDANYAWSDKSASIGTHNDTLGASSSADWTNAYLITTLPTEYVTLTN